MKSALRILFLLAGSATFLVSAGCPTKNYHPVQDLRGSGEFRLQDLHGMGWNTQVVVLGDVDGDGDLDAFAGNYGEQNRLLFNDGTGRFSDGTDVRGVATTGLPRVQDLTRCAVFGDVDGDGDLDLVVGNNGQNYLWINDGAGEFTDGTDLAQNMAFGLPADVSDTRAVGLVNVDGKGGFDDDLDLVQVNNGQNRLSLNDGNGEFLDGTDLAGTFTTGLPMDADAGAGLLLVNVDADVSGDADTDLVVLNEGGVNRLYLNSDGMGEFVDSSFDTLNSAASLPPLTGDSRGAASADLDGDGLVDLVTAEDGENRILINQGAGFFSDGTSDWTREVVKMDGNLYGVFGTTSPAQAVYTVGGTFDGVPPVRQGAVRHSIGDGSWNLLATNVTGSNLYAVWGEQGTGTAFAAGEGGTVLTGTPATGSWTDTGQSLTTETMRAVSGTTSSDVYVAGDRGILLHYTGAFSLERAFTDLNVHAVGGDGAGGNIILVGQQGEIFQGGVSGFSPQSSGVTVQLNDVWGDAPMNVFAVGMGGTVLRYWDQGGSQPLGWYPETSNTLCSLNAVTGGSGDVWAVGDRDQQTDEFLVLHYTSTGGTWDPCYPSLGYSENLSDVWRDPTSGDVFMAGGGGAILQWDVSASAWVDHGQPLFPLDVFTAVHGTANDNVLVVGDEGILVHYDGAAWTQHDAPSTDETLTAVWMDDASHAWVTATSGLLYRVDLSSWTWTAVSPSPTDRDLIDVWGTSASDVYVTSTGGLVLHYDGASWSTITSGGLRGLFAADATHLFAVGKEGLVLQGDGGGSWTPFANVPTHADLNAVWGAADNDVYAVGNGGTILHYDGASWATEGVPTTHDLYAVTGSGGVVWAAGDGGRIFENSGSGWDDAQILPRLDPGTTDTITGLWAQGTSLYACTQKGCLFHYTGSAASAGFSTAASADSHAVVLLSLDAGSTPDLLVVNDGQDTAWTNDGSGFFTDETATRLPARLDAGRGLALGGLYSTGSAWALEQDLTGDGEPDAIVACEDGQNRLYVGSASGVFSDGTHATATGLPRPAHSRAVALGDVDGDGFPDAIVARDGVQNRLFINRGTGLFDDETASGLPADTDPSRGVVLLDVDGDGDLDVVFANHNAPQQCLVNDGDGRFTAPGATILPADTFPATSCVASDLDGDGAKDLVFSATGERNRIYLMNGGTFQDSPSGLPADTDDTRAVTAFDADGDGAPDLFFANHGEQNTLFVNRLQASADFEDWTLASLPPDTDPTVACAAADLTGNGSVDLVVVNRGEQDRLLVNDGSGDFADGTDMEHEKSTGLPFDDNQATCARALDVDHDGDIDLIVGNDGQQNRLLLNDGAGEFTDGTDEVDGFPFGLPRAEGQTTAIGVADLDGDGDPDLYVANLGADEVLLNR